MIINNPFSYKFDSLPTLLLVIAVVVSGCSGSSDIVAKDEQPSSNPTAAETNNGDDNNNSVQNTDVIEAESDTENSSTAADDTQIRSMIPHTFEITVPYYLSDQLRVELSWGEINLTAMWVHTQRWSASGEFPTETEHPLTITFYDKNGAVELARYSQDYRVDSNATESVQILAEQFDANQFDSDEDGINNLVELNAGTDPFVDEDSLLEIVDVFALISSRSISVSQDIESLLQQDRPYVDEYEIECCVQISNGYYFKKLWGKYKINIDAAGSGTMEVIRDETSPRNIPTLNATRTNSGSAISWVGVYGSLSPEYFFTESFTNTVSVVDDDLRSFVQEITGSNNGTYKFSWENSANLTGKLIEGSSMCKPVAGTFTNTRQTNNKDFPNITTVVTNVSKKMDEPYWRVNIVDNDSETTEYFARDLEIMHDPDDEASAFFKCDFVDF